MKYQATSMGDIAGTHGGALGTLYDCWKSGDGPRFMHVGRLRLISDDEAAEWRGTMEAKATRDEPEAP